MEIWKAIKNYEGLYEVSNTGKVKSLNRVIINKHGKEQKYNEIILKPYNYQMPNSWYSTITLCKNHVAKKMLLHRLIAEAFIENCDNKPHINHIDNNGLNNSIENLEWCTHSENMIHAQKQGRLFKSQSNGGKVGGEINSQKSYKDIDSMIGKTFNYWKVISYAGKIGKNKKHGLECLCLVCNKIFIVEKTTVKTGTSKHCRKCSHIIRKTMI